MQNASSSRTTCCASDPSESRSENGCIDRPSSLLIIGGGSAAFAATTRAVELGTERVTLVNDGLPIGGTCVNVGCVPSKTLIRAAESLHRANHIPFRGVAGLARVTDFKALMRQKQELVEQLRQAKYLDVVGDLPQGRSGADGVVVTAGQKERGRFSLETSHLLAATGRKPNTNGLNLETAGVRLTDSGAIQVDETLRTTAAGVYAAGDVIGVEPFVYTAAYEGAWAASNAFAGEERLREYSALGWAVFTDPQVAGVGLDEAQARAEGFDAEAATVPLSQVPRCLVARDTPGFIKLIRDRSTDRLLGARILAPEGAELLMEAAAAIRHSVTVRELTGSTWPTVQV